MRFRVHGIRGIFRPIFIAILMATPLLTPFAMQSEQPAQLADFEDIAEKAGLSMMNVFGGVDTKKYIIETTGTGVAMRTEHPLGSVPPASAVQRIGTVRAGPDGDLILEPLNGVSYAQQARDRYECDIRAVDQTGFDPTKYDGGVPPDALAGKRADYLGAEAACLQNRGYVVE